VHLYDARGHARSEAPRNQNAYVWECLVSDFGAIAHGSLSENPDATPHEAVVGGLSLGAATALFWTLQNPDLVSGLVLAAYPESTDELRTWASAFADSIDANGLDIAGREFVWGPNGRFGQQDTLMVRRGFMQHAPHAIAAILRQSMANIPDISSLSGVLEQLRVPTLLVVGGEDRCSLEASRKIAGALPNASLAIIEGAGHVVNLSRPERFNEVLANFVRACSSS
jgi:pimeloyl-ACP methyl ester carboxylesterase